MSADVARFAIATRQALTTALTSLRRDLPFVREKDESVRNEMTATARDEYVPKPLLPPVVVSRRDGLEFDGRHPGWQQ